MSDQATSVPEDKPSRSEMQLYERAIKNGWPISPLAKDVVMSQIVTIAAKGTRPRDKIAAARVLIAADRNNIQRESLQMKDEQRKNPAEVHHVHEHFLSVEQRRDRVAVLAQRLGIDLSASGADAALEAAGSPAENAELPDGHGAVGG